jgi:hypothetical protein
MLMKRIWSSLTGCMLMIAAAACETPTEPGAGRVPGVLESAVLLGQMEVGGEAFPLGLTAPDTVRAGESFRVVVTTFGNGCVSKGDMEAVVKPSHAVLSPFDIHSGAEVCTEIAQFFDHHAELRFTSVGEATIRVRGRRVFDAGMKQDEAITIEKTVIVQ